MIVKFVADNIAKNPGDIEQHLYTLRGIGFPVSKLASEGYVIFHNRFQYGRI